MNSPIFIGGLYKSGTSLLRAMLSQHSNIAGGLETFWFDLCFSKDKKNPQENRNWNGTRNEPLFTHVNRLINFFDLNKNDVYKVMEKSNSPEEFLDSFMCLFLARQGKLRWVEKTPPNVLHIDRIFKYWPNAFFIHVTRDPRDVYASLCRAGKWSTPEEFIKLWVEFRAAYESGLDGAYSNQIIDIRYEDLVLTPKMLMSKLLLELGEKWEKSVADYEGDFTGFRKVKQLTGKSSTTLEQLTRPLHQDRLGAWVNEVDNAKVIKIESMIADLGYEDSWSSCKYNTK